MSAPEDGDPVFAAERAAWEAVKWNLPGHAGHDPAAWSHWLECSARANNLLQPTAHVDRLATRAAPPRPMPVSSLAKEDLASLIFEVERELGTVKGALDALGDGGGLLAGATGALLKRSLEAIDRALADAAAGLPEESGRQETIDNESQGSHGSP